MTNPLKTIIFFGTEEFSTVILEGLLDAGFPVELVITKPDSPRGRGHKVSPPSVKTLALSHHIDVLQPHSLLDIYDQLTRYNKPVGVLASYGKIIPSSILESFQPGIINVHPSLLPKYRGPSPIETALIQGDTHTGVSIMQLVSEMDAGPVYAQQSVPLTHDETIEQLYDSLAQIGSHLLIECLPKILDGNLPPFPQDNKLATYTKKIQKDDGIINWNEDADLISRKIRAYHQWPQCRTHIGTQKKLEVIITKASPLVSSLKPGEQEVSSQKLIIGAAQNALSLEIVKPIGKKEMPIAAFLQGYQSYFK